MYILCTTFATSKKGNEMRKEIEIINQLFDLGFITKLEANKQKQQAIKQYKTMVKIFDGSNHKPTEY